MVLFTPKKLTFKGSKKQHQILTQTAYYQAGKIVVQTILPEQPPVALITLNTLGTTCSTSADTYIPIENIYNTQSCSFLESRLVSLYGGKAASLLIEYQQRFTFPYHFGLLPLRACAAEQLGAVARDTPKVTFCKPFAYSSGSKHKGVVAKINHNSSTLHLASEISTASLQPTSDSSANESSYYCKSESALFDFVRVKAPIRCKTKKDTSWVSKQNVSWELLPHALQYSATHLLQISDLYSKPQLRKPLQGIGVKAQDLPHTQTAFTPTGSVAGGTQSKALLGITNGTNQRFVQQAQRAFIHTGSVAEKLAKQKRSEGLKVDITTKRKTKLINNAQSRILYSSELTLLQKKAKDKTRLVRTCFAGAGNNIFQSTLGNIEIQTATRLARIMVNYCNFYSLNKTSFYSLFTKYALFPKAHQLNLLPSKVAINSCFVINFHYLSQYSDTEDPLGVYPYGLLPLRACCTNSSRGKVTAEQLSSWQSKEGLSAPIEGLVQQAQYLPHTQRAFTPTGSVAGGKQGKRGVRGQEQGGMEYLLPQHEDLFVRQPQSGAIAKKSEAKGYAKYEYNIRVWAIKLNGKDKTPQENIIYRVHNNFYFAIVQSKNSLKICENKNSSYNIQRLSVENIGNYSQLNNSNFQLINSLQFSNLQRDRFYPNWFRLYLPDMEATKFLKNVANYYFSLGLQTLTFPSTKSSYNFTHYKSSICTSNASPIFTSYPKGLRSWKYTKQSFTSYYKLATQLRKPVGVKDKSSICKKICTYKICTASPFLTFLNKNTQKEKYKLFIPNIISYSYCPPSILVNFTSYKSTKRGSGGDLTLQNSLQKEALQMPRVMKVDYNPSFTKVTKNQLEPLNVPFSLLLENQIFPLNYNGFSIVEKELLYNALVNSSFAKAFYLINQNRQLLDFFVDYLLRFQILRQHQILYLFSTLLLGCNKIDTQH